MSKLTEVLYLVQENRKLRDDVEYYKRELEKEEHLVREILKFGETLDPEFREKCADAVSPWKKPVYAESWDFTKLVNKSIKDPHGITGDDND